MNPRSAEPQGIAAILAEWRAQQAHRADPVRFLAIEALERRAAAQGGEARRLLDLRLAALVESYRQAMAVRAGLAQAPAPSPPPRGALGRLADALAAGPTPAPQAAGAMRPGPSSAHELKALQRFRGTWARLSAEQRLRQALAQVPPQAGPLNSNHLVHRALVLMQETSPAHLQRFVAHVDALLSLDQMQSMPSPTLQRSGGARGGGGRRRAGR